MGGGRLGARRPAGNGRGRGRGETLHPLRLHHAAHDRNGECERGKIIEKSGTLKRPAFVFDKSILIDQPDIYGVIVSIRKLNHKS